MQIMFVDETGDHSLEKIDPQYPIFSLNGVIFEKDYYYNEVTEKFHKFKIKYFGTKDIILHSYDIKKQNGVFKILTEKSLRENFFEDLNNLVKEIHYKIISINILKDKFKQQKSPTLSSNPYTVSLNFLIERFVMHLDSIKDIGCINIESRADFNDKKLYSSYMHYFYNGTSQIEAKRIQSKIINFAFYSKKININGLQLTDLVSSCLAQKALGRKNRVYSLIEDKILSKKGKTNGIGLKVFP